MTKRSIYLRDVIIALTQKELKAKFKTTSLGFLWIIINPLIQMVVLTIVFSLFLRISVPNYPFFVFSGLLPWMYFTLSTQSAISSLVSNRDLIKKISFPREILPISSILANLYIYILALRILIIWSYFSGQQMFFLIFLIPIIVLQSLLTLGISLLLSSLDIYYRDISYAFQAILLPLFYLTPIFYPISLIPSNYIDVYKLNPLVGIITSYQAVFVDRTYFDIYAMLISVLWTSIILLFGYITFKKRSYYFAEWV